MKVLVINAGSSSLKYQVLDMENEKVITKGLCERIGIDGRHTNKTAGNKFVEEVEMKNHSQALKVVIDWYGFTQYWSKCIVYLERQWRFE